MDVFSEFVRSALQQDDRNIFSTYDGIVKNVPNDFKMFYKNFNPVDVEVKIKGHVVRLFSYEIIDDIQKEYSLGDRCFVFASCNGDPLYLKDGAIYSCVYSENGVVEDLESNSIADFFKTTD